MTRNNAGALVPVSQEAVNRVAVYGTLKAGYSLNPNLLEHGGVFIGNTEIPGILLHLNAYPALVYVPSGRLVPCEVYDVTDYGLKVLDAIEGVPDLYQRSKVHTSLGDCWVYTQDASRVLQGKRRVIPIGGWKGTKDTPFEIVDFDEIDVVTNLSRANKIVASLERHMPPLEQQHPNLKLVHSTEPRGAALVPEVKHTPVIILPPKKEEVIVTSPPAPAAKEYKDVTFPNIKEFKFTPKEKPAV